MSKFGKHGVIEIPSGRGKPVIPRIDERERPMSFHRKAQIFAACTFSLLAIVLIIIPDKAESQNAGIDMGLLSAPIDVPRENEPVAKYQIVSLVKNADGMPVAVNTRYSPNTGWVYTRRVYDCGSARMKTLASGETFEGMSTAAADDKWAGLVPGSSASLVGATACNVVGQ